MNDSTLNIKSILNISHYEFFDTKYVQQQVMLRSMYGDPIQAVHTIENKQIYLNLIDINLLLNSNKYNNNNNIIINTHISNTIENRWTLTSLISSSNLISNNIKNNNNKLRIMSLNLWNYNYRKNYIYCQFGWLSSILKTIFLNNFYPIFYYPKNKYYL